MRLVRLALKVVMQNGGDLMDIILPYHHYHFRVIGFKASLQFTFTYAPCRESRGISELFIPSSVFLLFIPFQSIYGGNFCPLQVQNHRNIIVIIVSSSQIGTNAPRNPALQVSKADVCTGWGISPLPVPYHPS
jgi:hypothetical protein